MTTRRRAASVRPGIAPTTRGQGGWAVALSVAIVACSWMAWGVPTDQPLSEKYPSTYRNAPAPTGSSYESENYNYPNVKVPKLRDGALTGGFCKRQSWC